MPVSVVLPAVNEATAEVTIGVWLRRPGDEVVAGEPLLEVLSDKVTVEVPAPASGILGALLVDDGDVATVGAVIATILEADDAAAAPSSPAVSQAPVAPPAAPFMPAMVETGHNGSAHAEVRYDQARDDAHPLMPVVAADQAPEGRSPQTSGRRLLTPRARTIVADYGLRADEVDQLPASGLGRRLSAETVLAYVAERPQPALPRVDAPAPSTLPSVVASVPATARTTDEAGADEARLPLSPMRRAIAAHMERSVASAPHGWMSVEIDMAAVVRSRLALRPEFEAAEGISLSFVPYVALAVVQALAVEPSLNATWEGDELRLTRAVHLGVAVAVEGGLLVPVIAGADGLNLVGLARAIHDRVERARAGRLTPADMTGGTITLNNTGAVGSVLSRPIINQPQVAIVTMEAIVRRPVIVDDDAIAIRPMMHACLSFDARAVDSHAAGRFLGHVRDHLTGWR